MRLSTDVDIVGDVATKLGLQSEVVAEVIDEFMLRLHRRIVEYEGFNGDYLGEEMSNQVNSQAYFHFLGFLDRFSERYEWEPGTAHEYIGRLWRSAEWAPFIEQMEDWKLSSRYRQRAEASGIDTGE